MAAFLKVSASLGGGHEGRGGMGGGCDVIVGLGRSSLVPFGAGSFTGLVA